MLLPVQLNTLACCAASTFPQSVLCWFPDRGVQKSYRSFCVFPPATEPSELAARLPGECMTPPLLGVTHAGGDGVLSVAAFVCLARRAMSPRRALFLANLFHPIVAEGGKKKNVIYFLIIPCLAEPRVTGVSLFKIFISAPRARPRARRGAGWRGRRAAPAPCSQILA